MSLRSSGVVQTTMQLQLSRSNLSPRCRRRLQQKSFPSQQPPATLRDVVRHGYSAKQRPKEETIRTIRTVLDFIVPGPCGPTGGTPPLHPAALFAFAIWNYLVKEVLNVVQGDEIRPLENYLWTVKHTCLWERLPKELSSNYADLHPSASAQGPLRLLMSVMNDTELSGTLFPSFRRQLEKTDAATLKGNRMQEAVNQWAMEQFASTPLYANFMSKVLLTVASTEARSRLRALATARRLLPQTLNQTEFGSTVARRLSILIHAHTKCNGKALDSEMRRGIVMNLVIAVVESGEGNEDGAPSFEQVHEELAALRDAVSAVGLTPTSEEADIMNGFSRPGSGVCRANIQMLRAHLQALHAVAGRSNLKRKAESLDSTTTTNVVPEKRLHTVPPKTTTDTSSGAAKLPLNEM